MTKPVLLAADKNNKIYDLPDFQACGMSGKKIYPLGAGDLIPLPPTSEIFVLPDRNPIGFHLKENRFKKLEEFRAVSAFIPPGYVQLSTTAYTEEKGAHTLPLFSYTPAAWYRNKFYVPAMRIDKRKVHDIRFMDIGRLRKVIKNFKNSKNRLINHLKHCALVYKCPNAINFFLGRYECPLPSSPSCNSGCIGCISSQPDGLCPPAQKRIKFIPTPNELAEIALLHLKNVRNPVLSFGQGCEGEPLLNAGILSEAIKIIRKNTGKGTININTNGSLPDKTELLCKSGIDSFRISLNTVREKYYNLYYKPNGYTFNGVLKSIRIAKKYNKFVSINYLTMPGFTDSENEFRELKKFITRTGIDMVQWRNLNYDPQGYFRQLGLKKPGKPLGIKTIISELKKIFPSLKHGYFNQPLSLTNTNTTPDTTVNTREK